MASLTAVPTRVSHILHPVPDVFRVQQNRLALRCHVSLCCRFEFLSIRAGHVNIDQLQEKQITNNGIRMEILLLINA